MKIRRIIAVFLIMILGIGLVPANLLAKTVRAKDGTAIVTARYPEQMTQVSQVSREGIGEVTIDPSDGSLVDEVSKAKGKKKMEDVIPMTRSRKKTMTSGNRKKNKKAIREYIEDQGLYSVREEDGDLKVNFPFGTQRLIINSSSLTKTCDAETAVYYAPQDEYVLSYESPEATKEAYETYQKEYGSDKVFLDLPVHADSHSWGVDLMNLPDVTSQADNESTRNTTLVALLDTGVNSSHEMFSGRTFSSKSKSFVSSSWKDDNGHGSHTAGTVAEGTSRDVQFLVLKVLDAWGEGSVYDTILALEYAMNQGADVANMSLGMNIADYSGMGVEDEDFGLTINTGSYYNYLNSFLKVFCQSGMTICVSSGNENVDIGKACSFPAKSDYVISVGAATKSAASELAAGKRVSRWAMSNYGAALDFMGPGVSIESAVSYNNTSYVNETGTSMAAPHVTAAAAMIKVYHPSYSFGQVYNALKVSTGNSTKTTAAGYGIPLISFTGKTKDVISRSYVYPGKPAGLKLTSVSYSSQRLSWNRVSNASGYVVYRKKGYAYQPILTTSGTSAIFKGLTCGKTYYYKVCAYHVSANKKCWGAKSTVVSGKPIPGKTAKITVKAKNNKIKLKWKKVAGATGYQIGRATRKKGKYKKLKRLKKKTWTNTGLKRKKKYYYRIRAYKVVSGKRVYGKYVYVKAKTR